jgi:host factor-I protein
MERDNAPNIQNDFFNQARKEKARLVVFLNSGKKLVGRIKSFDKFTVILDNGQGEQMIFKHAIATVSSIKTFGNFMNFDPASGKEKENVGAEAAVMEDAGGGEDEGGTGPE